MSSRYDHVGKVRNAAMKKARFFSETMTEMSEEFMDIVTSAEDKKKHDSCVMRVYDKVCSDCKMESSCWKKDYKKRECYSKLHEYIYGGHQDKVFVLYGLRRTGKTTLIRQIIADMNESDFQKSAFIQVKAQDDLAMLNKDLKFLEKQGYKYVFIDEVTLMEEQQSHVQGQLFFA